MKIKGIKYVAPVLDNSGYAKASRGYIVALHKAGIPVTVKSISFEAAKPDLGEDGDIIRDLIDKKIDYNIVLIHTTPEFWPKHREDNKVNIGYTIWETDKLHPDWESYINDSVILCMVGSEWNIDIFKQSGVSVPVHCVPHCVSPVNSREIKLFEMQGIDSNTFMFYSIFQWVERKSPLDTIVAYWHAFSKKDNVALVLKTYRSDYSEKEKDAIRLTISRLKRVAPSDYYSPIYLVLNMLSEDEITSLHARGDCYVSLDRGEGFGLSPFQAGLAGNPIIVTGIGGVTEFAKPDNSYLVDYIKLPVYGMPWSPWYRLDQCWGQASVKQGADLMRHVYDNREEAVERGKKLQSYINSNFSMEKVGKRMIDLILDL